MATNGSSGSSSKPPPRLGAWVDLSCRDERDRVSAVDSVKGPLFGVEAGDDAEQRVAAISATV